MSDEFHRPTLSFPKQAYNATQVRLYGLKAKGRLVYPENPLSLGDSNMNVTVHTTFTDQDHELNASVEDELKVLRKQFGKNDEDVIQALMDKKYKLPDKLPIGYGYQMPIDLKRFGTVAVSVSVSIKEAAAKHKAISCGIMVGYAYEGHTYDLPKPKLMIVPVLPQLRIPADDSGFDKKEPEGYAVWIVDKLDECVEFDMSQGFIEQLVLDANLPGKRAPTMYAGRMMMGHRGGRLNE